MPLAKSRQSASTARTGWAGGVSVKASSLRDRDSQGVAHRFQDRRMTIQLACPWCTEEVTFTIDETDAELVCGGCAMRIDFAPDPGVTYELLYASAA